MRRPVRCCLVGPAVFALALSAWSGCVGALPTMAGGRTTPVGRSDLATGAAVRIPVGELADATADEAFRFAGAGGAAPIVSFQHGLGDSGDLGVQATGTAVRASLRGMLRLGALVRLIGAVVPHVGVAPDGGSAVRAGGSVPLVLSVEVLGLYSAWIGARVAIEHLAGDLNAGPSLSLTGLRTGGVVGLAIGFRRLHVLVELGVDHELWLGEVDGADIERSGVSLTPAFAVRIRL